PPVTVAAAAAVTTTAAAVTVTAAPAVRVIAPGEARVTVAPAAATPAGGSPSAPPVDALRIDGPLITIPAELMLRRLPPARMVSTVVAIVTPCGPIVTRFCPVWIVTVGPPRI